MSTRSKTLFLFGGLGAVSLLLLAAGGSSMTDSIVSTVKGMAGRFFSWTELAASATARRLGIDNTPPAEAAARLQVLVRDLLDPLRAYLGRAIRISSGYRSPTLNKAIDGSPTSQHMHGEAVDFMVPGMHSRDVVAAIVRSGLPFDQAIWYAPERGGHVHLSYTTRRANRLQVLHAPAGGGYRAWSTTT